MRENLNSLAVLFTENVFRIPDYQRGYAWTSKQLEEFWDDLSKLGEREKHYTGTISLQPILESDYLKWRSESWVMSTRDYKAYYVVDGQQRLTTCVVLIQSILESSEGKARLNDLTVEYLRQKYIYTDKEGGVARCYIFGYDDFNPSYVFLKSEIFNQESESDSNIDETIYTENLKRAKKFFLDRLGELSIGDKEVLLRKLTQNMLFNVYMMNDEVDVFVSFETMNNRGKPLSHLELLKNRLIYLSTKVDASTEDKIQLRENINNAWRSVYYYLGKYKDRPLDDDVFLYSHFTLYFQNEDQEKYYLRFGSRRDLAAHHKQYLLDVIFSVERLSSIGPKGESKVTMNFINRYVASLQKYVKLWFSILNPELSELDKEEIKWLRRLNRLDISRYSTLLLSLYGKRPSKKNLIILFSTIERLEFVRSIAEYRYNFSASFDKSAKEFYSGKIDIENVIKNLTDAISKSTGDRKLSDLMSSNWRLSSFYKWQLIRYVLYEYEEYLRENSKSDAVKLDSSYFFEYNENLLMPESEYKTIEHIYPQTATRKCWRDVFINYNQNERDNLRNSLGNLLPLSRPKNAALGNQCFEIKKHSGQSLGYIFGSYSENQVGQYTNWTALDIKNRGIEILDFMIGRFQLGSTNEATKLKILNLHNIKRY